MKLIDADAEIASRTEEIQKYERRIEELEGKNEPDNIRIKHLINVCKANMYDLKREIEILKNTKTAYDVDKVVEQLDKASDCYECEEQGREHVQMVDLTDAIEIVKAGELNE